MEKYTDILCLYVFHVDMITWFLKKSLVVHLNGFLPHISETRGATFLPQLSLGTIQQALCLWIKQQFNKKKVKHNYYPWHPVMFSTDDWGVQSQKRNACNYFGSMKPFSEGDWIHRASWRLSHPFEKSIYLYIICQNGSFPPKWFVIFKKHQLDHLGAWWLFCLKTFQQRLIAMNLPQFVPTSRSRKCKPLWSAGNDQYLAVGWGV